MRLELRRIWGGDYALSDNWIVGNLQSAFETWNGKISEIWSLITTTPQAFHGGAIWTTIVTINEALKAVGYGLLVLFLACSSPPSPSGTSSARNLYCGTLSAFCWQNWPSAPRWTL